MTWTSKPTCGQHALTIKSDLTCVQPNHIVPTLLCHTSMRSFLMTKVARHLYHNYSHTQNYALVTQYSCSGDIQLLRDMLNLCPRVASRIARAKRKITP